MDDRVAPPLLPRSGGFGGGRPHFHAYRLPETSLDAEVNGRETKLHQALSSSAGHFAAQCLGVSSDENKQNTLLQTSAAQELLPCEELSEQFCEELSEQFW
jgi:hypothetical protein